MDGGSSPGGSGIGSSTGQILTPAGSLDFCLLHPSKQINNINGHQGRRTAPDLPHIHNETVDTRTMDMGWGLNVFLSPDINKFIS